MYDGKLGCEMVLARYFVLGEVPQHTLRLVTYFPFYKLKAPLNVLFLTCISIGCLLCSLFKGRGLSSYVSPCCVTVEFADF